MCRSTSGCASGRRPPPPSPAPRRTDLAQRLNKAKDGSITPASYSSHGPSRERLFTDVVVFLGWKGDGKGPQKLRFAPSPSLPGSAR
ncbi:hypothetical protein ABZ891_23030 [Streptomyces sp. NPDC047023]|uniref:hypothetical protein n=1 Tax=Streptomyces sp. NPDC047023 TaxID=3155139 RepID=UPI0033C554E6